MNFLRVVYGFDCFLSAPAGEPLPQRPSSPQWGEDVRRTDEGGITSYSEPVALSSGAPRHLLPFGETRDAAAPLLRTLLLLLLWFFAFAAPSFAADPVARATLQSKGKLYVGQQVLIDVAVLVPNYFLEPPQFPLFDLPDANVSLQDGQALNLNETIDGTAYSGIQRTYIVVPQRDGSFNLPAADITFGYAAVPGQKTQGKANLPSLQFTVEAAPGSASGKPGVVAAKVTITQDIAPDPGSLKAGDTLTRTVTLRAEGLRAMMIPAPEFPAPDGVRVYGQDPELSEETDARSQPIAGLRKDVARYLFANAGQYALPAITVSWFDPTTAKSESVTAPAINVTVVAAPAEATGLAPPVAAPETPPFNWFLTGMLATTALVAGLAIWLLAGLLSRVELAWESKQSDRRQSEAAYFGLVEQACHDGSPSEIAKALDRWARRAGIVPLRSWLLHHADQHTIEAYDAQQRSLYGRSSAAAHDHHGHDAHGLETGLKKARVNWLARTEPKPARWKSKLLPSLNPNWGDRQ